MVMMIKISYDYSILFVGFGWKISRMVHTVVVKCGLHQHFSLAKQRFLGPCDYTMTQCDQIFLQLSLNCDDNHNLKCRCAPGLFTRCRN